VEAGRYAMGRSFDGVSPFTGFFPPHPTSCPKVRHQTQQPGDGLILPKWNTRGSPSARTITPTIGTHRRHPKPHHRCRRPRPSGSIDEGNTIDNAVAVQVMW
jgi:hypothetical protein